MKVAILGSKGFVGSRVAQEALSRGWLVNHIGSRTPDRAALLRDADAVVHSVGSFMRDKRYKQLVSQPVSARSLAKLALLRLGLSPPSPLEEKAAASFDDINFGTVKSAVDALLAPAPPHPAQTGAPRLDVPPSPQLDLPLARRTPFVFISASRWALSDPEYIASKRRAEEFLLSQPALRAILLRPGMVAPPRARACDEVTPRHLVDLALTAVASPARVSVDAIAVAACDAIADENFEGVIDCDVLRELDSQEILS